MLKKCGEKLNPACCWRHGYNTMHKATNNYGNKSDFTKRDVMSHMDEKDPKIQKKEKKEIRKQKIANFLLIHELCRLTAW